jgi:hypothetical protein
MTGQSGLVLVTVFPNERPDSRETKNEATDSHRDRDLFLSGNRNSTGVESGPATAPRATGGNTWPVPTSTAGTKASASTTGATGGHPWGDAYASAVHECSQL